MTILSATNGEPRPEDANGTPEWIRVPDACRLFAVSRSKLYEWIADGRIRSFCLRERNAVRGIRLISYDSLKGYLNRLADAHLLEIQRSGEEGEQ